MENDQYDSGLLEDQMNRKKDAPGQDTERITRERDGFEIIVSQNGLMEFSDSHGGDVHHAEISGPGLLSIYETDNKRTHVIEEEENEEAEDLVVLDPEHPLMKRFQSALKKHLSIQLEKLNLELSEKTVMEKAEVQRRQGLAEEVYMMQEMLAKLQASLEANHEANAQAAVQRRQAQDHLEAVKSQYQATANQAHKQNTQVSDLQSKVDSMALIMLNTQEAKTYLCSDIKAIINASNKAQRERTQAEENKHQQDLYVERLTKHTEKLSEKIILYEGQITAQTEETKSAKEILSEAQLELDSLTVERKQLFQQWNSSVVMMRRRDEAYNVMHEELRLANDQMRSIETKMEGYKKSIAKEEEQNEHLTLCLNRAQTDCTTLHKLITHFHNNQEFLQTQYSTYTRTLQETEKTLGTLLLECDVHQSKLKVCRTQMEGESAVRLNLEYQIMNKLQEQFTHSNAAKYSRRLTDKIASQRREKEAQSIKQENDINAITLEGQEVRTRLNSVAMLHADLEKEMCQQHLLLSSLEAEISRHVTDIEQKQTMINIYNKKIKEIVSSTGHEDLGPMEICAATLSKELEEVGAEIKEQQQLWLWQQGELVLFTQEKQTHSSSVQTLRTQLTILQQSKIRKQHEMEQDQHEQADLENQIKAFMADTIKLNSLLLKNSDLNQALQQSNSLMETEFRQRLKEAKKESIETQLKQERLNEEKERLMNSLVEAERLILLWNKRTQLMRETWSALDSDIGQGDIRTMRAEIHRMEVRYAQLIKHQKQLLRDMESVVARRETIIVQREARSDHMLPAHTEYHNTLQNLRRKILQTKKISEEGDGVITELEERQHSLCSSLKDKQMHFNDMQNTRAVLTQDLSALEGEKERNLSYLLYLQSKAKHLQAVKEGRYCPVSSGGTAIELAKQKQQERLNIIRSILQPLIQVYPQHISILHRLSCTLADHLNTGLKDSL